MVDSKVQKNSDYIEALKAIAIFFVVCAHTYPTNINGIIAATLSQIMCYWGSLGVPIFFIISGYLFGANKRGKGDFVKTKIKQIVIPWFFCYTLLYLYVKIRKGGLSLISYVRFVIGNGSSAYYLTMLIIMYVLFWYIKENKMALIILGIVSVISIICTGFGIYDSLFSNYYLNPLNWIIYFEIGIIAFLLDFDFRIIKKSPLLLICLIVLSFCYFVVCKRLGFEIYYFSKLSIISNVINVSLILVLAAFIYNNKYVAYVGKISFSIYLLNQFFCGAVIAASEKLGIGTLITVRPIVEILNVFVIIKIVNILFKRRFRKIKVLIGIRV